MLPGGRVVLLRFTHTVVPRRSPRPKWIVGAVAAGVVGGSWFAASSLHDAGEGDAQEAPHSTLGRLRQQLSSLWGPSAPDKQQDRHSQSLTGSALAYIKATAARWLAKKAEDPESREALLALGSGRLLDFLVSTATEDLPSQEQQHAEQAVVNFLGGYHTASRLLARPGAVPYILHHIAAGRASAQLTASMQNVLQDRAADFSQGLSLDDAKQTIKLLQETQEGSEGSVLQGLVLQLLTAWAEAGQKQQVKLCSLGLAHMLGQLAMQAVAQGDSGRELQGAVCRLQRQLLVQPSTVTDAELATWMQPLLYLAADAAAAAAAAAAASSSSVDAAPAAAGVGMMGSAAGAADLALADAAMSTLAAAVAVGGPLVKDALKGLHWLPTLDCLALSPDPAIKARAAAALAALATAGQLDSQEAQIRWRDMLLRWLGNSTANLLLANSSGSNGSSDDSSTVSWLWSWFSDEGSAGGPAAGGAKGGRCQASAADEVLARSCVAALRALAQQDGPLGLSVAQLWLSRLLQQLSSRVAAYTSITQLAQTPAQAAAAAAVGLLPRPAKADASPTAAAFGATSSGNSSSGIDQGWAKPWLGSAGSSGSSSWWWWGSSSGNSSSSACGTGNTPGVAGAPEGSAASSAAGLVPPASMAAPGPSSSSSSSWYWPFSCSTTKSPEAALLEDGDVGDPSTPAAAAAGTHQNHRGSTPASDTSSSSSSRRGAGTAQQPAGKPGQGLSKEEALLESARASIWRDAAPVTAASARAAADDLKAAANAMLTAWLGAAGSLSLPSDLLPGMFTPAVVEAYPMAARLVDFTVAQQRTCQVLELLASVVAEDPSKQTWLLSAGILPVMERLALHPDAALEPQAFLTKYDSSSSSSGGGRAAGKGGSSSSGDAGGGDGGSGSLSARIGRTFWGWKGSSTSDSDAAAAAAGADATGAPEGSASGGQSRVQRDAQSGGVTAAAGAALGGCVPASSVAASGPAVSAAPSNQQQHLQQQRCTASAQKQHSQDQQQQLQYNQGQKVEPGAAVTRRTQQLSTLLLSGLANELDFSSSINSDSSSTHSHPAAAAAVASVSGRLADAVQSRFTAAALVSPRSAQQHPDTTAGAAAGRPGTGPDTSQQQRQQQHYHQHSSSSSAAMLMEFAQGAAGWDEVDLAPVAVSRLNGPGSRHNGASGDHPGSDATTVPQVLADNAAVITAAAEEGASWADGDGLTLLCLQRQVARILSMLALQPAAAQQLTEAVQQLPGGAAGLLLQNGDGADAWARQQKQVHAPAAAVGVLRSGSRTSMSQVAAAPGAAAAASAVTAAGGVTSTAAWLPWLLEAAASQDCLLSSYAAKALLHLESAVAYSGSRRRQQQQQYMEALLQRAQRGGDAGAAAAAAAAAAAGAAAASSGNSTWGRRLYQELRSSEDLSQLVEGLWPFSSSSSAGEDGSQAIRPPVYYPDGIHLMHPTDGHNWGLLQPPPLSLIDSLSAAAASAASAAAAVAASDLSHSDIDVGVDMPPPSPGSSSGDSSAAAVAAAASAVANAAAAAAAAAAASALGAEVGQVSPGDTSSTGSISISTAEGKAAAAVAAGSSSSSTAATAAGDVGFLQPAVSWLAQRLVKFAEIKEEEAQQALQEAAAAGPHPSAAGNPGAPLATYQAVQALVDRGKDSSSIGGGSMAPSGKLSAGPLTHNPQQQQGQQVQQVQQQQGGEVEEVVQSVEQPAPPEVDIVFVHGIRGGPFVSWRKGTAPSDPSLSGAAPEHDSSVVAAAVVGGTISSSSSGSRGVKRKGVALKPSSAAAVHSRHMTQEDCWPAAWLAADVPTARLLTVEYKAPVTGWEGESLSLPDCGRLLLDKLVAAGIGQRPVVFVCHSMGGLIVKEMLAQALEEPSTSRRGRLATSTCALAFYATPHFGSGMAALGWKLRHLPGASPAPSIHHLSPGPHLAALNARLASLHDSGRVAVLSFCEGLATNLAGLDFMPRILIVPFESGYPGFGEVHVLRGEDHITLCKPASREAPGYRLLLEFVRASVVRAAEEGAADAAAQAHDRAAKERAAAAAEAAAASS